MLAITVGRAMIAAQALTFSTTSFIVFETTDKCASSAAEIRS